MGVYMSENASSSDSQVIERSFYLQDNRGVSLVDVAAIVCRQWKVAIATFLILILAVAAFALTLDTKYTYNSVYKVAERQESDNNPLGALERPSAVVKKVRTLYTGGAVRALLQQWGEERLDFSVDVTNPSETLLVVLASDATQGNAERVKELHQRSLQQALEDQQATLDQRQQTLEKRRRDLNQRIEGLDDNVASGELAAAHADQLADIDAKLADLAQGEVVQLAERSVEPVGLGRFWILLLGIVAAFVIALASAWIVHFLGLVANALRDRHRKS